MKTAKEIFGARIKELRESKGLNQEQLAELINLESRHLSRIETGKSFTTLENVEKIAQVLEIEVKDLFDYGHYQQQDVIIAKINKFLGVADPKDIEFVYKTITNLQQYKK